MMSDDIRGWRVSLPPFKPSRLRIRLTWRAWRDIPAMWRVNRQRGISRRAVAWRMLRAHTWPSPSQSGAFAEAVQERMAQVEREVAERMVDMMFPSLREPRDDQ